MDGMQIEWEEQLLNKKIVKQTIIKASACKKGEMNKNNNFYVGSWNKRE